MEREAGNAWFTKTSLPTNLIGAGRPPMTMAKPGKSRGPFITSAVNSTVFNRLRKRSLRDLNHMQMFIAPLA
jgi:hypothetical protein